MKLTKQFLYNCVERIEYLEIYLIIRNAKPVLWKLQSIVKKKLEKIQINEKTSHVYE